MSLQLTPEQAQRILTVVNAGGTTLLGKRWTQMHPPIAAAIYLESDGNRTSNKSESRQRREIHRTRHTGRQANLFAQPTRPFNLPPKPGMTIFLRSQLPSPSPARTSALMNDFRSSTGVNAALKTNPIEAASLRTRSRRALMRAASAFLPTLRHQFFPMEYTCDEKRLGDPPWRNPSLTGGIF
jgi:hypothetical protein